VSFESGHPVVPASLARGIRRWYHRRSSIAEVEIDEALGGARQVDAPGYDNVIPAFDPT
jgi:hypothetical protein